MAGYGGGPFGYFPVGSAVEKYGNQGRLLAFKLGGAEVPLPDELPPIGPIPEPPEMKSVSKESLENGMHLFTKACAECHWNINGGYPDLRRMTAAKHEIFKDIVYDGILEPLGMAGFSDLLTEQEVDDIHNYLIKLSHEAYQEENK